ncbi:MAG TPA: N-acetyl sugar amidotransferase [Gemmatimonadales bacterium]|nr:N-acetyl sugar amidotransferase [Gemmatimonadales bacterium]
MADNAVQELSSPRSSPAPSARAGVCVRCVMDTSDPEIRFDEQGVCNHCHAYDALAAREVRTGQEGKKALLRIVDRIKARGRGKQYDCVMGVSGGVDSTYLAYIAKQLGLRPLAVHMDNGWDSELAVSNIEKVLKTLSLDLYTEVLDWEEFRDLQLAFLKASVSDAEIPTDHAIGAAIYRVASERGIRYVLSGENVVTEGILPGSWTYGVWDWKYIRSVHQRFGSIPLRTFPHYSLADLFYYRAARQIRSIRPLNFLPYAKGEVMRVLQHELGWKYYGGKHYESIYTRFFQGYILPRKFGIDKRKAHLSTLICSGQITRAAAFTELSCQSYTPELQRQDHEYVTKKLGLRPEEFAAIMALPIRTHRDFANAEAIFHRVRGLVHGARRLRLLPASPA